MNEDDMRLEMLAEYAKNPKGTYVAATLTKESKKKIKELCINLGIQKRISSDKMHTTIIYSRKRADGLEANNDIYPATAKPIGLEVFDTRDGKKALVLRVKSKVLSDRHNFIMDEYGTTYDFPEYNPHITLTYDAGEFDPSTYEGDLPTVEFESEYVEDLVLDWNGK